ncbi:putative transcription regulator IWS1 family [Helianthus anomalus]
MYGRLDGEVRFHRWHMWPVPSSSTPSVAAHSSCFVFIDNHTFSKDGRKINVGDCALFEPPHNSLPFVGRIRKLKLGKDNNISLFVNWLYRPADVKLKDGVLLKAAPNEVFYSFHKDEIPVASLLHPCKVTFLRKGVELPSGISSFVCRQVYDVKTGRLWWLTDRNYINSSLTQDLQEEINQLLDKTLIEMHGSVRTGGRSPKPLNGPNGSANRKPNSDNIQNSSSSISSHAKSKKRAHGVHNSESVKRDRLSKVDDADSRQLRPEHRLKTEIAKITDKGGLVDIDGVEKLIQLMRPEGTEKQINLACRKMLVDVISGTDRFDCLGRFAHLKGLQILDEWLQEIHKGNIGDEKSVEQFLFSLLRALDKLPVNLHALQMCNVGKSVNHLRGHKNPEIQKKARSLVSTWKKRVEAEMNMIETKSSTSRGGSWSHKPMISDVSPMGSTRRIGGSFSEVGSKSSASQSSALKAPQPKQISGEAITTSPTSPGSTKLSPSSANSQSCSSDHVKTRVSSVSHSKNSHNGFVSDKESPARRTTEANIGKSRRLIVRLPNTSRSPAQTASLESPEDSSRISGKGSLPVPSKKQDKKVSGSDVPNTGDDLCRENEGLIVRDDEHGKKDASFGSGLSSGVTPKLYETSYSSINALVESCAKFSEASVSPSIGDDGGIILLASVAAAEMSRSDVSPACSPDCNSPVPEDVCSVNAAKLRRVAHDAHVKVEQIGSVRADVNGTGSANLAPDVKPLEEKKCVDDILIRNTVSSLDAAATCVKPETAETNEEINAASWSSSDMRDDEKESVHKQLNDETVVPTSCGDVDLAPKSEETDDEKCRMNMDSGTSVSELAYENTEKDDKASVVALQEIGTCGKATCVTEANCVEDRTVKLNFDLNEVLPSDDGIQYEDEKAAVDAPDLLPSNDRTQSDSITVAAAAKGPFYPSESLLTGKPEIGWKGSAATSAFRPTEPRKVDVPDLPVPDTCTDKPTHALFDFDLNVGVDDAGQHNAPSGLEFDLNACEENPEPVQLSVNTSSRPSRSTLPGFDLNGPGTEEFGGESITFSKNSMQFISGVPNVRMNNTDTANFSNWFPPNIAYPAITIPSQRMMTPVTSSTSLNPDIFRGPVLSSSTIPLQYPAFPFEPGFSLPSVSNAYADSPSYGGGPLCFPTFPLVGPNGVVSMPYYTSLPGGSSNVGPDGKTFGSQALDLNAGPRDDKLTTTLRQLRGGGGGGGDDEQLRMFYQLAASGGGGAAKRKEPDGGWDGDKDNRISYKHPHRQ